MKTTWKVKVTALLSAVLILTGIMGVSMSHPLIVAAANEVTWVKEDFQYRDETTIISFSEAGIEKAKTTKELSFPEGVTSILGNYSYSYPNDDKRFEKEFGRRKEWDKVVIPSSVTYLGYGAFYEARIKEVSLPNNLNTIEGLAFFNTGLPTVTLPESLGRIGANAFERCGLTEVIIPKSVSTIEKYAFSNNKLHTINILGTPRVSTGAFHKQKAEYHPEMNPFYEAHFGYNGKIELKNIDDVLSYKDGEFSFLSDDVNEGVFDFSLAGTSYAGTMKIVNSHKWSNGFQTDPKETKDEGTQTDNKETQDGSTQTAVEVKVLYLYEDGTIYKEQSVNAEIGTVLDGGDLPIIPDNMKFNDDFLFYEVTGKDDVIKRTVATISQDSQTQTDEVEKKDASTQTDLTMEDIKKLEDKSDQLDERLKKVEETLAKEEETNKDQEKQISELKAQTDSLVKENQKLQDQLKSEKEDTTKIQGQLNDLEKRVSDLEKKAQECCKVEVTVNNDNVSSQKIEELTKKLDDLSKKVAESNRQVDSKETVNQEQKKQIEKLLSEKTTLQKQLDELKKKTSDNKDISKEVEPLEKKYDDLNKKLEELKKLLEQKDSQKATTNSSTQVKSEGTKTVTTTPVKDSSNTSGTSKVSGSVSSTPIKETTNKVSSGDTVEKEVQIRYPNKLTPKGSEQLSNTGTTQTADSYYGSSNTTTTPKNQLAVKTEKSDVSKANASVTENVDNANGEYPIHHEEGSSELYSADARQFVTFQTKSGKTFHLIINHDEATENVLLLTEVSEADLMHMVEEKEEVKEPIKEVVKEEPEKIEPEKEPVKEEKSNFGTYLILILVIGGVVAGGYYFKVVKGKEQEELKNLEEPEDYVSEASDDEPNEEEYESGEVEEENHEDDEDDIIL